ncbi:hypothetical protein CQA62_03110 [Helicobacter cholecystus]|uniref:Uncharacterized protein n=1 Tax=Helicobacter cholecystus TaxID=45498 RepID=A0A3D8IYL6_9HELI|nr:hypothetical protein [Helicobacter cholecystus]RDU69651.1 hypothetical protein CQA62_03110 [Helicobacter cholecystus]VEJ24212.1 Uncharacterised protein [Helicobacter cholecystus]
MRRNSLTQKALSYFVIFLLYIFYCTMGNLYIFLPPLLGLFFILFAHALRNNKIIHLTLIIAMLLWLDCERGMPFGGMIVYFLLLYAVIFIPLSFLLKKKVSIFCIGFCYLGLFFLLGMIGNYGATSSGWFIFGIFTYYACIEGLIVGILKI